MVIPSQVTREGERKLAAVRKAIGDSVKIIVDANQRLDVHTNVRLGNAIEPYDIFWYEEPVYADNIGQCAEVARRINIPVATGENEYTRYGFRDLVEQKAAAIPRVPIPHADPRCRRPADPQSSEH